MRRNTFRRHRSAALALAAGAAVTGLAAQNAQAGLKTWAVNAGGNWSTATNWSPATIPAAGDSVFITFTTASSLTVAYDYTGPAITLNALTLDNTGGGTNFITMAANNLTVGSGGEFIGNNSRGSFSQTGGTHTITGTGLEIGFFSGSLGSYTLGGGSLSVSGAGVNELVGVSGTGSFTQTGGTNAISSSLNLGDQSTGSGLYSLSAGSLNAGSELVGNIGTGTFLQSGGTNTVSAILYLGTNFSSNGSYVLSGGTLNASNEWIGLGGSAGSAGSFTQTGGTNAAGNLFIAPGFSRGVYNFSNGAASATSVAVGGGTVFSGGMGTLNVSGTASLAVTDELEIWSNTGSSVHFNGGTIIAGDLNTQNVPANFVWTGGTLNLTNSNIVFDSTATGTAASLGSALTLNSGQALILSNGNETIAGGGTGSLTLNGGSINTISGATTINPLGMLTLKGGTLNTSGTLTNHGSLTYSSGTLVGRVINQGTLTLAPGASFEPTGGVENDTTMTVTAGQTLTSGPTMGLDNFGTFTLSGGTINTTGATSAVNDYGGTMTAWGEIDPNLINNGTLSLGGVLNEVFTVNNGVLNVPAATLLRGSNGFVFAVTNANLINLTGGAISNDVTNNGVVQGGGSLSGAVSNNAGGIISANIASLPLNLTNFQGNSAGAQIKVADNSSLQISNSWTNNGVAMLSGPNAVLGGTGSTITNTGTIAGQGTVSASINNTTGVVRAEGGELTLGGAVTNAAGGQIEASSGATALFAQGLSTNGGTIALSGGTFDNNNQPLTNNGAISGNGTLRTGGLTNTATGTISLADVASSVLGSVSNTGHINITSNTTTFYGAVTNNAGGVIKVTTGTSRFLSTFTNNGTFSSDPATNYFQNLSVGAEGILLGGGGDQFIVSGDLITTSTRNTAWNTEQALLEFTGGENHTLAVSGTDQGPSYDGFANNFSWGILRLDSGDSLTLQPESSISALYVDALALADGVKQISSISGDGVNLYYDPSNPANAYLNDQTYALSGGGAIAPVPEPAGGLLIGIAAGLLARRRRSLPKVS
ncbi:MAG TPA: hypothetical protein VK797_02020 [Tepidisphaeraceae bacterium]|nr:hypothetical protein [Tepidisphaeraceae bacterium]